MTKRFQFGIFSASFYIPGANGGIERILGKVDVLGNGTFEMKGTPIELRGGANKFAYSVQQGAISADIAMIVKEIPDFLFEVCLGKAPTALGALASGQISVPVNSKGTSIINALNGVDDVSVLAASETNLKFGKYMLKATAVNELEIYLLSDSDAARGDDVPYINEETLNIVAASTIIAADNNFGDLGFKIVGVGVMAFTVGDTATFEVLPISDAVSEVTVGGISDIIPEVGVILVTQPLGDGSQFEIDCPKCTFAGLNLGGSEKAFTETPLTGKVSYDSGILGVAKIRMCRPSTVN